MSEAPSLGLHLQSLKASERVLALTALATQRSEDGWIGSALVVELNRDLRLPNLGVSISKILAGARARGEVVSRGSGPATRWSLSPEGDRRARALLAAGGLSLESMVPGPFTAPFLETSYPTLDPGLAPPELISGVQAFLSEFPFDRNVFLMTRFPTQDAGDPVKEAIETLRSAVGSHDLVLHVASDRAIVDALWPNVAAHMWSCRYGLGLLETSLAGDLDDNATLDEPTLKALTLNDNVVLELGSMLTLGRRCKILKDRRAPAPPTDLTAQIYRTVDVEDPQSLVQAVHDWVIDDLLLRR